MDRDDPEQRAAELERRLAEQRSMTQPDPRPPGADQPPGLTTEDIRTVAFSDAAAGEHGYNHDEVDAFLDHIAPALHGQTGRTFTAEWVRSIAFSAQPRGKRGYAAAEVDAFVERVAVELDRRAGRHPVPYPSAAGSPHPGATAAVPQPAAAGKPGVDNRTPSRRGGLPGAIGEGLIDFIFAWTRQETGDYPNWIVPVVGVILIVFGTANGNAASLWLGIAVLIVSAVYLGFKLLRKLVPPAQPRDDQSPPGRHSAR
jgi:DivIVA domain-containing protein